MVLHFLVPLDQTARRAESASSVYFFLPHLTEILGQRQAGLLAESHDGAVLLTRTQVLPAEPKAFEWPWCCLSLLATKQDLSSLKTRLVVSSCHLIPQALYQ